MKPSEAAPPRLLLVGGGHAHVQVLESRARSAWPPVQIVLLSPDREQFYTGMVPGLVQGQYEARELTIDLPRLCEAAGAEFVYGSAVRVRADSMVVESTAGALAYDMLSLDIGSVPHGIDTPGVREHALSVRPLERSVELRARAEALAARKSVARVVIVGGGAGGVEIAFAVHRLMTLANPDLSVSLIDRGDDILDGYPRRARTRVRRLFRERGIGLLLGRRVERVESRGVVLAGGESVPADLVVWVTGPDAPPLIRQSGLPRTDDGFLKVDMRLRVVGDPRVWGAGDCVTIEGVEIPKAGVYAVRAGAVLADNLRSVLSGGSAKPYRPQRAFLSILNTADGKALLRWRGLVVHGRAAWRLKDWIDRRWVRRFERV